MSQGKDYYVRYWYEKREYTGVQNPQAHSRQCRPLSLLHANCPFHTAKILDLGCGKGEMALHLTRLGHRVYAVDISREVLLEALKCCPEAIFVQADLGLPLPFAEESFDFVFCLEVFEHLFAPDDLARDIQCILVRGGTMICCVSHHGLFRNVIIALIAFEAHYRYDNPHIRFFKDRSLQKMIESGGQQVIRIFHIASRLPFWPTNSMALCRKRK